MSDTAEPLVSYAPNGEDIVLWRALGHLTPGYFVDVGACDPVVTSITKLFSLRGWTGINIEPLPHLIDMLERDRPDDINLRAGAVGHRGRVDAVRRRRRHATNHPVGVAGRSVSGRGLRGRRAGHPGADARLGADRAPAPPDRLPQDRRRGHGGPDRARAGPVDASPPRDRRRRGQPPALRVPRDARRRRLPRDAVGRAQPVLRLTRGRRRAVSQPELSGRRARRVRPPRPGAGARGGPRRPRPHAAELDAHIDEIHRSSTWRVGAAVHAPVRLARRWTGR